MQICFNKIHLLYWFELKTQKHMKYTNSLRNKLQKHTEDTGTSWYEVAKETGLSHQLIYNFRKDDKGITFEHAIKIMKYLNLTFKDLK